MISFANDNNRDIGQPLFVSGWVGPLAGVADTESIIQLLLLYGATTSQKHGCAES